MYSTIIAALKRGSGSEKAVGVVAEMRLKGVEMDPSHTLGLVGTYRRAGMEREVEKTLATFRVRVKGLGFRVQGSGWRI